MLERLYPILKMICLGLGALLLYQCAGILARRNPLAGITIPVTASASAKPTTPVMKPATNSPARAESKMEGTNSVTRTPAARTETNVPPAIQARVDRITQSEIFGPIPKPKTIPMALLGIAGRDAFLRAPSGETGLVREGGELGGVKLLRIGTNRVLVEHEGQQKELTIFSGFGGETLLPKGKEKLP